MFLVWCGAFALTFFLVAALMEWAGWLEDYPCGCEACERARRAVPIA